MTIHKQAWTLLCDELPFESMTEVTLTGDEYHYATRVLRLSPGETVRLTDGKGGGGVGAISSLGKKELTVSLTELTKKHRKGVTVHLWLALPRPNVLEDVVSLASEMGAATVCLFQGERSFAKGTVKIEKLKKISLEALRVSKSHFCAEVFMHLNLASLLSAKRHTRQLVLFCDELLEADRQSLLSNRLIKEFSCNLEIEEICLVIGPEAGFSENERAMLLQEGISVSLGTNTLRVAHAAACAIGISLHYTLMSLK